MIDSTALYKLGIMLIFVGVITITIAIVLSFFVGGKRGELKGGEAVIVGPIPIISGTDKESLKLIYVLSFILTLLLLVAMVFYHLLLN